MTWMVWRRTGTLACATMSMAACAAASAAHRTPSPEQATAGPRAARFDSVRAHVQRLVAGGTVPSMAVAVAKDGVILWEEGFGRANRERGIAATPHTPYSLASVTKSITGTAVMVLAERGRLDLDAPIEQYLGGIRLAGHAADTREVTPRLVLAHSAGLPTHYRAYFAADSVPAPERTLGRYGMVVFRPGSRFEYSNIGYRALDVAVSRLSGKAYGQFLRDEVFRPLGMTRSALGADPAWASQAAIGYDAAGTPIAPYRSDHPGSGDVWASAHDLLRFGMFHVGTPAPGQVAILSPRSIRAMQRDASPTEVEWGLGWQLGADRGYRLVEHGGGQPGVAAQLALYPDERLAIVVLSNMDQAPARDVARRIAAAVLPETRGASAAEPAVEAGPPPPADLSGTWVGTVATDRGQEPFALAIHPQGDVHASLGTLFITSLVREVSQSGGAFTGTFHGVLNTSDALPHRHTLTFTLIPRGDELTGQLTARGIDAIFGLSSFVRLRRLDEARLNEYVGAYRHGENDLRLVTRQAGRLVSQRGEGRRIELEPLGEDYFLMVGTGGATLRFIRENGRIVEADWSGRARARRVD